MAPGGGGKRKRPERQATQDDASPRPSPHRPEQLSMAQQAELRGGRGGSTRSARRQSRQGINSPVNGANGTPLGPRTAASPSPAAQIQTRQAQKATVEASRPATPAVPEAQPAEESTKEPPAPFFYDRVTDEHIAQWEATGKDAVQTSGNEADEFAAVMIIEELVRSSLDSRLSALEAGSVVGAMITHHAQHDGPDVQSLLFNLLCILDEADWKNPNLLTLITTANVDPERLRQELDIDPLKFLSLVRPSFITVRTRKTTNILYRQANFNLLREETEGYAKLVTEYFNTSNESVKDHEVSAEDAFQRVMALVGSFDLDVGRVLDITLDISANALVRAYYFFVKFYRCSSWWPSDGVLDNIRYDDQGFEPCPRWAVPGYGLDASEEEVDRMKQRDREAFEPIKRRRDVSFWQDVSEHGMQPYFELGGRRILDFDAALPILEAPFPAEKDGRGKEVNVDKRKRIDEDREYMRTTGFLPPRGNPDAAQLLGFKFRFYASPAREETDVLSENLVHLAALLIKIGFISLRDLYPHLYPLDEDMPSEKLRLEKEKAEKEIKERPGGGVNALAMAGALPDDTVPAVRKLRNEKEGSGASTPKQEKKEEQPKAELPAPTNQKIALLKALLLIGALPEALYILGRFPWLVDADATLPPYLLRIAKQMLSEVAASLRPMRDREALQDSRSTLLDNSAMPDGTLPTKATPVPKGSRWLGLDQVDSKGDGLAHRFYYTDWDENIPVCQNIDDVFSLCNSFLGYLGVKIGQDVELLGTLIRIAKHSLSKDFSTPNCSRWLELMKTLLVPSLSISKHNPGLTQAVYDLLKMFPTATRYNIYAEWYSGKTSRIPDMRVAFDHSKAEVRDVLRRVTNETGKKQARALAKVSFSSPGIVMTSMINQLESYSNMIPSLVECTRYFSFLAYDVLTWCLINSLSGQGRNRMQADGMLTSSWLQALSQFVASLFNRYSVINPSPVLQYLASELRQGSTTDLELFEQVLAEMGGIKPDLEFGDNQVLAMAGGEQLRSIIVQQLHDKRHVKKDKAARLLKALSEPGLISQMLVSIAQERQMYSNHETSKFMPLKVLGANLDKIQLIFAQYLEVLKTHLKPEDLEKELPGVVTLVGELGIKPGMAFTIARTTIMYRIAEFDANQTQKADPTKRRTSQDQSQVDGDVEMKDDVEPAVNKQESGSGEEMQVVSSDDKRSLLPRAASNDDEDSPWHPVLQPLIVGLSEVASHLADSVSIPYFVTFWTLSLQDILVHPGSYENELARLRTQISDLTPKERTTLNSLQLKDMDRKKRALVELQDKLRDELKGRIGTYQKTRNRLSKNEKDHWFPRNMDKSEIDARHLGLLQECFLPRAILSSLDAQYCYLMLKLLHDNGTPGFSTMHLLNQLLKKQQLAAIMFQCTANEAHHFGRFLGETLRLLQHWHSDKLIYEKEGFGKDRHLPGFAKKLDSNGKPEAHLEFEEFRRLLFNWHTYLNGSLHSCFESVEYMHIRNGIMVLRAISPVFPHMTFMGKNMYKQIEKLSQEDPRQDLKLSAMSLLGPLKAREKLWILPQAFRLNDASKDPGRSGSRQPSARPETPQSSNDTPKLDASAPEFKPGNAPLTNGTLRKVSVAGKEDGEVEDEKLAVAKIVAANGKEEDGDQSQAKAIKDDIVVKDGKETFKTERPSSTVPAKETAKPSTPAAVPFKPPPSEAARPDPTQSSSRHALPSRPDKYDSGPPTRPLPNPPIDRSQDEKYGRLSQAGDMRPVSRGHSPSRPRARTPERDPYYSSRGPPRDERGMPGPPRDERGMHGPPRGPPDGRYGRDEQWARPTGPPRPPPFDPRARANDGARVPSSHGPPSGRETVHASPYSTPQSISRPAPSSQPSDSAQTPTAHSENPARLALINDDTNQSREGGRNAIKDARSHPGNRSPPSSRSVAMEPPRDAQPRADQATDIAPNGPRRGRSSRDLGSQAASESSYGRLNGPQEAPPSGPSKPPNGPGGRGVRSFSGQAPPTPARPNEQPAPSPTNPRFPEPSSAPRGPSGRAPMQPERRSSGIRPDQQQQSSNSVPTTPTTENGPAVHPSRMKQLAMQPPPLQTNTPVSGPQSTASPMSAPPSGPRGASNAPSRAPTGPSSSMPPSGPSASTNRATRGNGQLADINATLSSAQGGNGGNGQSVSFRGAARQAAPVSTANEQPVLAIASSMEPPPRRDAPMNGRRDGRVETSTDLFGSRPQPGFGPKGRAGPRQDSYDDRQHSSRQPSRDHRSDDVPPVRPPPPPAPAAPNSDERRGPPRDERRGREEPRDNRPPVRPPPRNDQFSGHRGPSGPGAFAGAPPPEWDRSHDRPGPPNRDAMEHSRSGRSSARPEEYRGGRREEERRPPPPPEGMPMSGDRKRRHEGGSFEGDKRRRSGR